MSNKCQQLCSQLYQARQAFQNVSPLCSFCTLPATYIHDDQTLRCFKCLHPSDRSKSLHLNTTELNPKQIIDSFTSSTQKQTIIKEINQIIDTKIAQLNNYRETILDRLPLSDYSQICQKVLKMQLDGLHDVIKGSEIDGFTKMKESWLLLHEGLKDQSAEGKSSLRQILKRVEEDLEQFTLGQIKPQLTLQSPFPTNFKLQHLHINQVDDKPLSVLSLAQNHWIIGCQTRLIEITNGMKVVITDHVEVQALAMMEDGTIIGSDCQKKKLFILRKKNLIYLNHTQFKDNCFGIFTRPNGDIFYTDCNDNKIMRTTLHSKNSQIFLQEVPERDIKLNKPAGIVQFQGNLVIANSDCIMFIDNEMMMKTIEETGRKKYKSLIGMTVNEQSLLVCENGNKRLLEVWIDGKQLKSREINIDGVSSLKGLYHVSIQPTTKNLIVPSFSQKKILILKISQLQY